MSILVLFSSCVLIISNNILYALTNPFILIFRMEWKKKILLEGCVWSVVMLHLVFIMGLLHVKPVKPSSSVLSKVRRVSLSIKPKHALTMLLKYIGNIKYFSNICGNIHTTSKCQSQLHASIVLLQRCLNENKLQTLQYWYSECLECFLIETAEYFRNL